METLMRYALYTVWAIALLSAAACAGAGAQSGGGGGGTRVAVVDLQKVLLETESGKKARESLNSFMKNRQAVMELEEKELKRMEDDMIKQTSVLTPNARKEREDQLRRRVM